MCLNIYFHFQSIGCDVEMGSTKFWDKCGVCDGRNETCVQVVTDVIDESPKSKSKVDKITLNHKSRPTFFKMTFAIGKLNLNTMHLSFVLSYFSLYFIFCFLLLLFTEYQKLLTLTPGMWDMKVTKTAASSHFLGKFSFVFFSLESDPIRYKDRYSLLQSSRPVMKP